MALSMVLPGSNAQRDKLRSEAVRDLPRIVAIKGRGILIRMLLCLSSETVLPLQTLAIVGEGQGPHQAFVLQATFWQPLHLEQLLPMPPRTRRAPLLSAALLPHLQYPRGPWLLCVDVASHPWTP